MAEVRKEEEGEGRNTREMSVDTELRKMRSTEEEGVMITDMAEKRGMTEEEEEEVTVETMEVEMETEATEKKQAATESHP